jgi:hypothetical protein
MYGSTKFFDRASQEYISPIVSNQLIDCFLLDNSNIVNDVPENDDIDCAWIQFY